MHNSCEALDLEEQKCFCSPIGVAATDPWNKAVSVVQQYFILSVLH